MIGASIKKSYLEFANFLKLDCLKIDKNGTSTVSISYFLLVWVNSVHSGLRFNLNLCLFLQTFNAISESEYVKIGSMRSGFLEHRNSQKCLCNI